MKSNTEQTETVTGKTLETLIANTAVMKMTAKTWKRDALGVLQNFAWVNASTAENILARLATVSQEEAGTLADCAVEIIGTKGTVFRGAQRAADGRIRVMTHTGGYTGFFDRRVFEETGLNVIVTSTDKLVKSCDAARSIVKRAKDAQGNAIQYDILCRKAEEGNQYYGSIRTVNGKLVCWHEEHESNVYNEHELSAVGGEKARNAVRAEFGIGIGKTVSIKNARKGGKVKAEALASVETVGEGTEG